MNHAVELINVSTPAGGDGVFLTNRHEGIRWKNKDDEYLSQGVADYFAKRFGPGYTFINLQILAENVTKEQGKDLLAKFLAVYKGSKYEVLNKPRKNLI